MLKALPSSSGLHDTSHDTKHHSTPSGTHPPRSPTTFPYHDIYGLQRGVRHPRSVGHASALGTAFLPCGYTFPTVINIHNFLFPHGTASIRSRQFETLVCPAIEDWNFELI